MSTIYKLDDLGGPDNVIQLCVPGGIGDISWVYSKIKHLKSLTGREILVYVSGEDKPHRGGDFVQLLPEVKFGGYLLDRSSFTTIIQSIPADWPVTIGGIGLFHKPQILNVAANIHLESGRSLKDWLPMLPTDYHYPLNIPTEQIDEAHTIMSSAARPAVAVYVSNRAKEQQIHGGWNLWSSEQWIDFLVKFGQLPECKNLTYVFLGAEYDRDKTEQVASAVRQYGFDVKTVIGRPLGVAAECLRKCHYCLSYPGGLGILANVLHVPGLMLLPWILKSLEQSYADPVDLGYQKYRAWADPTPEEALKWVRQRSIPHSFQWLN